jgi:exodeoxyribonuclease VII large subunit
VQQPTLFQPQSLSVTDLTRYLRGLLESDEILKDVWVSGEISNYTRAASGHVYLTIKDAGAALKCVIWKTSAGRIRYPLQNGLAVEAHGAIGVYERDGAYQLYVDAVRPAGEGRLYMEFLRLKARLEAEGLFDEERKRPLPAFPRRIGIVTSPTGAALQDMLNTLKRRYPLAEIILAPSAVQGDAAPAELVKALGLLAACNPRPDVILLARGGGSLEDLWAFNDERVVRAVADSPVPVVSGVGHETDFTLADFAADLRAPTPTGAAALATPDSSDLKIALDRLVRRLEASASQPLQQRLSAFESIQARLERTSPRQRILNERQRVDMALERARAMAFHRLELERAGIQGQDSRLDALNPMNVLRRGFAAVFQTEGSPVTSIAQVATGQAVRVHLADGKFTAQVSAVESTFTGNPSS